MSIEVPKSKDKDKQKSAIIHYLNSLFLHFRKGSMVAFISLETPPFEALESIVIELSDGTEFS